MSAYDAIEARKFMVNAKTDVIRILSGSGVRGLPDTEVQQVKANARAGGSEYATAELANYYAQNKSKYRLIHGFD